VTARVRTQWLLFSRPLSAKQEATRRRDESSVAVLSCRLISQLGNFPAPGCRAGPARVRPVPGGAAFPGHDHRTARSADEPLRSRPHGALEAEGGGTGRRARTQNPTIAMPIPTPTAAATAAADPSVWPLQYVSPADGAKTFTKGVPIGPGNQRADRPAMLAADPRTPNLVEIAHDVLALPTGPAPRTHRPEWPAGTDVGSPLGTESG